MTTATPTITGWRPTFLTDLRAFHGDDAIKATYLARVHAHRLADDIRHGFYWEDGKGCAVGCTVHSGDHSAYETELGIPRIIARLEDRIFEGMGNGNSQEWPERFLSAIPVGANLSLVWPRFAVWLLVDEKSGVIRHATTEQTRDSIRAVAKLYERLIAGDLPARTEWQAASNVAWRRYYAVAAAVAAAAADDDDAAAVAAADDDDDAAAAVAAATRRRSYADSYSRMADKLVELLGSAPVPEEVAA